MEGTLERVPLTEVLQGIHSSRQSAVLHVAGDSGATKRVYFKDGDIVFASSDVHDERLGEILVRNGKLKRSELDLACKVRESSNLRLGKTLVDMGYLSADEMDELVRAQVESILRSVLPLQSGAFRTELRDNPVDEDLLRGDISTENILLEAVRRLEDADAIRQGIGDLSGTLRFAKDSTWIGTNLQLTPEEGFVLSRVDGESTAQEIAKLSPMGEDETLRCICALVVAGVLDVEMPKAAPPPPAAPSVERPAPPPTPTAPKPEPELSPRAFEFREEMLAKHARAHEVTYYELLEIEPNASLEEVKAGYFRLAKKLHPDHRAGLKLDDPEGIFDDLYLAVKAAYEVLSSETERRRYDFTLEKPAPVSATSDAPPAQEKAPKSKTPERTFDAKQMARLHYSNGQKFYDEQRFHEALEELQNAVRLDGTRPEYHRLLARVLAKNPKWRRRAEEHYLKVLAADRFNIETMLELGELYEAGGMETRARKMYEEALGMDPGNERAIEKLGGHGRASAMDKLKDILQRSKGH